MDSAEKELRELRALIAQLTERVYRIEQAVGLAPSRSEAPVPLDPSRHERPRIAEMPSAIQAPSDPVVANRASASLESRIGSQWLNRIGIVAMLVGVSFFLKYAFENNWIGPAGRVAIGLIAGVAVIAWSERFQRRGYLVFSWSLKATGVGTLYLSLWAAFQLYHLISSPLAFLGMAAVTVATAAFSLAQNAEILAFFALIGGFATPLLISTGQNHELFLFSYVSLLNVATLVVVARRPWRRLLTGALIGTIVLYTGWYVSFYSRDQLAPTLVFLALFFAVFAACPIIATLAPARSMSEISRTLIFVALANAAACFLAVYVILEDVSSSALAGIAVMLAGVYLLLRRQIQTGYASDDVNARVMMHLYAALALAFVTTAVALEFDNYWITIGWLIESAVLLWLAYRRGSTAAKLLALVPLALAIGRLLIFDEFHPTRLVFNPRFEVYMLTVAALAFATLLASGKSSHETRMAALGLVLLNLIALIALNLEARDYFMRQINALGAVARVANYPLFRSIFIARDFTYSAIWLAYGAVLMWVGFWRRSAFLRWQALILLAVTIIKVFAFDTSQLERGYRIISFIALGVVLLAVSFIYQRDWLKLSLARRE